MKIVVISVVKIESDILESFVRHSLTFADEILIADNASVDDSADILQQLVAEGLPLTVRQFDKIGFAHGEIMTDLMWEAIEHHQADLVLPLDIDEFLVCTEECVSCRSILEGLDREKVYMIHSRTYMPEKSYASSETFLLAEPCQRELAYGSLGHKVVIGAGVLTDRSFCLIQGCHYVYRETPDGDDTPVLNELPRFFHVAHFHWRSDDRYMAKSVVGWLGTALQYTTHTVTCTYLKNNFNKILRDRHIGRNEIVQRETEPIALLTYCENHQMRYGKKQPPLFHSALMRESERIAEAYAEEISLRKEQWVDIVLPFFGALEPFQESLMTAIRQTYPYKKLYVCDMNPAEDSALDTIVPYISASDGFKNVICLRSDASANVFDKLEELCDGVYVYWMLPGCKIENDFLKKIAAAMIMQDYEFSVMIADKGCLSGQETYYGGKPFCDDGSEAFCTFRGSLLWRNLLRMGQYPVNALDNVLVKRSVMQRRDWFRDGFSADGAKIFAIWRMLLQPMPKEKELLIGAFRDESGWNRAVSVNEDIRQQMEWFRFLVEDQALLSPEELQQALNRLFEKRRHIENIADQADKALFASYEEMLSVFDACV